MFNALTNLCGANFRERPKQKTAGTRKSQAVALRQRARGAQQWLRALWFLLRSRAGKSDGGCAGTKGEMPTL